MSGKRYFWLKLRDDFFESKRIKKLRKLQHGDTLVVIYLKMQLKALKTDGVIEYAGVEDSFDAELALDLNESEEDVARTIDFLLKQGLCEATDENMTYTFPYVAYNTGSETASTQGIQAQAEGVSVAHLLQVCCKSVANVLHCNKNRT